VCIALFTIVAHNTAQNRRDNFPSSPPDNHHCSDDVYVREGPTHSHRLATKVHMDNFTDDKGRAKERGQR